MKHRWIIHVCLGMSVMLCGCSVPFMGEKSVKAPVIEGGQKQTPANRIVVTELDILDRPYSVLGDVVARYSPLLPYSSIDKADVVIQLREEAAKMGADAVVYVIYTEQKSTWISSASMEAKGKAVKFTRY